MLQSKNPKPKACKTCGNTNWKQFNTTDRYCSWRCANEGGDYNTLGAVIDYRLKDWAVAVKTRDKWTCRRCGKHPSRRSSLDAHHVKMKSTYIQFKYDVNNGICLCHDCHMWVHANPKEAAIAGWLFLRKYQQAQVVPRDNILEVL